MKDPLLRRNASRALIYTYGVGMYIESVRNQYFFKSLGPYLLSENLFLTVEEQIRIEQAFGLFPGKAAHFYKEK